MTQPTPPGTSPAARVAVGVLLFIGVAGAFWVPLYARSAPKLGDFPFFYWFQLIWMPVVAILVWISYLLLRTRPASGGRGDEK
jgi:hypothetical protein